MVNSYTQEVTIYLKVKAMNYTQQILEHYESLADYAQDLIQDEFSNHKILPASVGTRIIELTGRIGGRIVVTEPNETIIVYQHPRSQPQDYPTYHALTAEAVEEIVSAIQRHYQDTAEQILQDMLK